MFAEIFKGCITEIKIDGKKSCQVFYENLYGNFNPPLSGSLLPQKAREERVTLRLIFLNYLGRADQIFTQEGASSYNGS